jgi:hypothetical protein
VKIIETTSRIDVPPEIVWGVITDFRAYSEWNPFITSLEGDLREGARLRATFQLPDRKPRTFRPTVTVFDPGQRLVWLGRVAVPKLFDAEHGLTVRALDSGTEFVHTERFRGVLPPLLGTILTATREAFNRMDAALIIRAESRIRPVIPGAGCEGAS